MGAPETPFQPIALTVALDDARQQQLAAALAVVEDAQSLVIDSPQMAEYANTFLRDVKTRKERVEAMHEDICGPIRLALANARKWFTPSIDANDQAERIVKAKLSAWTQQQARIADEARRKAAEEARRVREEAERKAAAERARAEQAAAEARRKAEDAAKREAEAKATGNARAAAAAAAERARREEEERQKREDGERKAQEIEMAAASAPVAIIEEQKGPAGFSMRKNWIAELAPDTSEDDAILQIVRALAGGRTDLVSLLDIDWKAAKQLAKAQEKNFNVPGLKARNDPVPTSRG
jgi:hypothetical protein